MTTNEVIAICLFAAVLIGRLTYDDWLYKAGKKNTHLRGPIITAVVLTVCSILCGWLSIPMWLFGFWALFDTFYALLIGQKWYYTGTTSKLDKLQAQNPALKWFKYVGMVISIIVYIKL